MKLLARVLFLLFILAGVLVAVSNRQPVELSLWPLPHLVVLPLYLLVIGLLLLGVLAGLGLGWMSGRHHRRRAREASGEAARLDREVQRLRESNVPAAPGTPAAAAATLPRDQRAIERQRALVAPDLARPVATRGPFA
ncbi:MAG: lipopolysaccharide assembly protein LapA domain-containing protein [Proteobacteria bacterium]|nr:lipopolysaccharide assembly protein LapA domain-containing protein [Pseudomonadota bacterium]